MNRGSKRGPTLRRHKRSGHAFAKFNGRQIWFGPWDEREAHSEFAAFRAQWESNGRRLVEEDAAGVPLVEHVVASWLMARGETAAQAVNVLGILTETHGREPADRFTLAKLRRLRARLTEDGVDRAGVNAGVEAIKAAFELAAAEGTVARTIADALVELSLDALAERYLDHCEIYYRRRDGAQSPPETPARSVAVAVGRAGKGQPILPRRFASRRVRSD